MREPDPDGASGGGSYYYAQRFAGGMGRAYIGYSEAMQLMGARAADMRFRRFSMTGDHDIPVFYVDAAAVNAHIPDEKRALALVLLNLITGPELMIEVSENGGAPRYLFAARESVYDALAPEYPIYGALKDIAMDPEARVFRIKPDGVAYVKQAKQSASLLPVLRK